MKSAHRLAVLVLVLFAAFATQATVGARAASAPEVASSERAEVRLHASVSALAPGETALLALDQMLMPTWHSYWINPGDAGMATTISWSAPEGVTIGEIQWPTPKRFLFEGLMNYGYADRATLLSEIAAPADWPVGEPIVIEAQADWLVCADICVPEGQRYTLEIPTAAVSEPNSRRDRLFRAARADLPVALAAPARFSVTDDAVALLVAAPELAQPGLEDVYFFPAEWGVLAHAGAQTAAAVDDGLALRLPRSTDVDAAPEGPIEGVLTAVDRSSGETVTLALALTAVAGAVDLAAVAPAAAGGGGAGVAFAGVGEFSVLGAALFAFLGGLILNLMPCVFPVLALKALSFANHADAPLRERAGQGLAYGAGVLLSFLAFAGALIALKAGGAIVGWGFQLQTPIVVAILAYVLFAVGLNLSGVFEFGGAFAGVGGGLADRRGRVGSFFTGVLAALVASPCTAPFMGAALGYAVTQDAPTALAVFGALGLGFAAPIMALSAAPGFARMLPRPGPWMVRFRQALAFPMYAAAAWLLWVLGNQVGVDALFAALIGLVLVAFAAWAIGVGAPASPSGRRIAAVASVAAMIAAVYALAPTLDGDPVGGAVAGPAARGAAAEPYDAARIDAIRAEGRSVFLNMTADWCISCKVNERVVLTGDGFDAMLDEANAVYMKGDWTRRDPAISEVLAEFGRVGVPLYVVYPPTGAPIVLPQILTEGLVREALSAG